MCNNKKKSNSDRVRADWCRGVVSIYISDFEFGPTQHTTGDSTLTSKIAFLHYFTGTKYAYATA
jgi:hypothetical protein